MAPLLTSMPAVAAGATGFGSANTFITAERSTLKIEGSGAAASTVQYYKVTAMSGTQAYTVSFWSMVTAPAGHRCNLSPLRDYSQKSSLPHGIHWQYRRDIQQQLFLISI